jgi:uncharacterized protein (TIGR02611 family)
MLKTLQQAKRFLKILFGFTLLAIGAVMIVTPGPGWLTIMIGLGVLAAEYVWARRLLDTVKEQGLRVRDTLLPRTKIVPAEPPATVATDPEPTQDEPLVTRP